MDVLSVPSFFARAFKNITQPDFRPPIAEGVVARHHLEETTTVLTVSGLSSNSFLLGLELMTEVKYGGDILKRPSKKRRHGQHFHLELVLIDPKEMLALQAVERTCTHLSQFTLDR